MSQAGHLKICLKEYDYSKRNNQNPGFPTKQPTPITLQASLKSTNPFKIGYKIPSLTCNSGTLPFAMERQYLFLLPLRWGGIL